MHSSRIHWIILSFSSRNCVICLAFDDQWLGCVSENFIQISQFSWKKNNRLPANLPNLIEIYQNLHHKSSGTHLISLPIIGCVVCFKTPFFLVCSSFAERLPWTANWICNFFCFYFGFVRMIFLYFPTDLFLFTFWNAICLRRLRLARVFPCCNWWRMGPLVVERIE